MVHPVAAPDIAFRELDQLSLSGHSGCSSAGATENDFAVALHMGGQRAVVSDRLLLAASFHI